MKTVTLAMLLPMIKIMYTCFLVYYVSIQTITFYLICRVSFNTLTFSMIVVYTFIVILLGNRRVGLYCTFL